MKRGFIVTVGTSLVAKARPRSLDDHKLKLSVGKALDADDFEANFTMPPQMTADSEARAALLVKHLKNRDDLCKDSAELAALFNFNREPQPFDADIVTDDRIHLIATRTVDGAFCGLTLKTFLETVRPNATTIEFPKFLGDPSNPEFARRGLPGFLNRCLELVKDGADEDPPRKFTLLPNGGYKTLLGYLTILGLTQKLPVEYIYEDSTELLRVPSMDLGVDVEAWIRQRNRMLMMIGSEWTAEAEDSEALQRNPNNFVELSPIGEWLEKAFRARRDQPVLNDQLKNTSLHEFLGKEGAGQQYSERFLRLAEIGGALWTGDQLTDMVDHASRHHFDLFELAERVLLPLTSRDIGESHIEAHELFVLLAALYLHDCGNVVGYLPETGRMTEKEVRDWHPVLGYLRLQRGTSSPPDTGAGKTPDWCLSKPIYEWLLRKDVPKDCGISWNWPAKEKNEPRTPEQRLWEEWMCAIATLGVYHSSRTPLNKGDKADKDDAAAPLQFRFPIEGLTDTEGNVKPLVDQIVRCGITKIDQKRLLLLAALLRIIDALDQQAYRAGNEHAVAAQLADLQREIAELDEWLKQAEAFGWSARPKPDTPAGVKALFEEYKRRQASRNFKGKQAEHLMPKTKITEIKINVKIVDGCVSYTIMPVLKQDLNAAEKRMAFETFKKAVDREHQPGSEMANVLAYFNLSFEVIEPKELENQASGGLRKTLSLA